MRFRTAQQICRETPPQVPWVSRPWVAAGAITEVVGKPKTAGKTTWILHMVHAVLDGTDFMGEPTEKTAVVYLTEERHATFRQALERTGLSKRRDLIVLQWRQTFDMSWQEVVAAAVEECNRRGAQMLVVDTVSQFAHLPGDTENYAGEAFRSISRCKRPPRTG